MRNAMVIGLTAMFAVGCGMEMGAPVDKALVGSWLRVVGGKTTHRWSFYADGTFRRAVLSRDNPNEADQVGTYSALNGRLLTEVDSLGSRLTQWISYRVSGDRLIMPAYLREGAGTGVTGAWGLQLVTEVDSGPETLFVQTLDARLEVGISGRVVATKQSGEQVGTWTEEPAGELRLTIPGVPDETLSLIDDAALETGSWGDFRRE